MVATIHGAISSLNLVIPGTTFSNVTDRGAYRSHKTARLLGRTGALAGSDSKSRYMESRQHRQVHH